MVPSSHPQALMLLGGCWTLEGGRKVGYLSRDPSLLLSAYFRVTMRWTASSDTQGHQDAQATQAQGYPVSPHWTQCPQTVSLREPFTFFKADSPQVFATESCLTQKSLDPWQKLNALEVATGPWRQEIQDSRKYASFSNTHASFRLSKKQMLKTGEH